MTTTRSERQQRYRARRKAGLIRITVEIDEVAHIERMIEMGFLDQSRCEDRDAIADATARLLAALVPADVYE